MQSISHIPTLKIYWVCAMLDSISDVWQYLVDTSTSQGAMLQFRVLRLGLFNHNIVLFRELGLSNRSCVYPRFRCTKKSKVIFILSWYINYKKHELLRLLADPTLRSTGYQQGYKFLFPCPQWESNLGRPRCRQAF